MTLKNFVRKIILGYRLVASKGLPYTSSKYSPLEPVDIPITISHPSGKPITIPLRIEPSIPKQPPRIPIEAEKQIMEKLEEARAVQVQALPFPGQIKSTIEEIKSPMEVKGALELIPRKRETKIEGFEVPSFSPKKVRIGRIMKPEEQAAKISLTYPLIPKTPKEGEPVFAYARIYWKEDMNKYVYEVVEPPITEAIKSAMTKVRELLEQKLDIDFTKLKKFEAVEYLHKNVDELLGYFGIKLTKTEKDILHYYIDRDFIGLGRIEPMMNDSELEDISCDGVGIPIYVFHRNPDLNSVETNVVFDDSAELDSFIIKLSQLSGKSISVASPLVGGSLPDGSRVQATLATDIARRGSNFTIRRFTEEPLTPVHLLLYNALDVQVLAFLWLAVDFGRSILVSGGTASGKTTMLNVLSLFIKPTKKIVSIEDTPELKLPHPHWVPTVARTAMSIQEGRRVGEVDMFDLLKESLRQRPDYIIVGEVRGKEAFVLFQEMATGHPSLATIHAENEMKLMDRLTTPPIALPSTLLGSLDLIVFLLNVRFKDKHVRRVNEVIEVVGVDQETNKPITNVLFRWNPIKDSFDLSAKSAILKKISDITGLSEQQLRDELERRMFVLNWMIEKKVLNYRDVYNILNIYYAYPERILSAILGEV